MTIVYTLVCILAFISFVVVTFIRPRGVRVPLMLIMLIGWGFELSILDLNGAVSNQDLLWILWQERARASEALDGYAPYIIRDWALVAIVGMSHYAHRPHGGSVFLEYLDCCRLCRECWWPL